MLSLLIQPSFFASSEPERATDHSPAGRVMGERSEDRRFRRFSSVDGSFSELAKGGEPLTIAAAWALVFSWLFP